MGLSEEDLARIRKIRRLEPATEGAAPEMPSPGVTARPQPTTEDITGQISFSSREAQILEAQRRTAEQERRAAEPRPSMVEGVGAWAEIPRAVSEIPFGLLVAGIQKNVIPGEQEIERKFFEAAAEGGFGLEQNPFIDAADALRTSDLPSGEIHLPFRIPLPGGRSLKDIQVGLKGAGELAFDPFNLLFLGGGGAARAAAGQAARTGLPRAAREAQSLALKESRRLQDELFRARMPREEPLARWEGPRRLRVEEGVPPISPEDIKAADELLGPPIPKRAVERVVEEAPSIPERYTREWPFGAKPGEEPLQMGATGQPLRGMREEAAHLLTTRPGLKAEISQLKKMIRDEKNNKRRAAGQGEKRSKLARYDAAIKRHEQEVARLQSKLNAIPEQPRKPIPRERALALLNPVRQAQENLDNALRKAEPEIFQQEFDKLLPDVLERAGMTPEDFWDLRRGSPGVDILDVNRMARERAAPKIANMRQAGEREIADLARRQGVEMPAVGGRGRQGIEMRPTKAEAELGPQGISANPAAGLGADPALGRWSRSVNQIASLWNDVFRRPMRVRTEELEGVIETAKRVKNDIRNRSDSLANVLRQYTRKGLRDNFIIESKTGHILDPALQNKVRVMYEGVEVTLESPTLQDIAARYDVYRPFLTDNQKTFMDWLRSSVEDGTTWQLGGTQVDMPGWNRVLRDNMPGWDPKRVRTDITGDGFYISRGKIKTTDKKTFSITNELDDLVSLGERSRRGPIPAEKQARMPAMGKLVGDQGNIVSRGDRYELVDKTLEDYVKGVADRIADTNLDERLKDLAKLHPGETEIRPRSVIKKGIIKADDAFAAAINREFRESIGTKLVKMPVIKHVNNLYRGIKANWDLSAIGIHGGLAVFRAPKQWKEATGLTFRSLAKSIRSQRGQEVIDDAVALFDTEAEASGRLVSQLWAFFGLRQGGVAVETALPGAERLMGLQVPVIGQIARGIGGSLQLSNRLFGAFGDILRLKWADELLRAELAKGKTIKQMSVSQGGKPSELQQISNAANRLTGWSDTRFGGDLGETSMFASRFFQSRIETLGQSLVGVTRVRPPTREALGTLGQTRVNLPFRGRPLIESDVLSSMGRAQTIESKEALQTMVRLIGIGAFATELANAMLGNETDRRPFVDGRVNPNLYVVRLGGRDFSLFGPTVGLFRALGTLAADPSPQGLADAGRGLGSGVLRLVWDNMTGFGFMGEPAPVGIVRGIQGDPEGWVADPDEILAYIADLVMPIAPGAVLGELYEGAKSAMGAVQAAMEGDWEQAKGDLGRVAGAAVAAVAEVPGIRVSRLSRQDEADEMAKEMYGKPYEELAFLLQDEIDDRITEELGERSFGGSKGYLREQKAEANAAHLEGLGSIAKDYLTADITSDKAGPGGWSATIAREKKNELEEARRDEKYGTKWDPEKQRTTGGINEKLYDRDAPREEPEKETLEHRIWQYYKLYEDSLDENGKIVWDEYDRLSSEYWGNLTVSQRQEMLMNIRRGERKHPEEIRKMVYAGRYAQGVKLTLDSLKVRGIRIPIEGHESTYWGLREHPALISYIASMAGVTGAAVREYLDLSYAEREQRRHAPGKPRIMQEALEKAGREGGILASLQQAFIENAPREWIFAMMEAGYKYRSYEEIHNRIRDQIREGGKMPPRPYEELYKQQLDALPMAS